MGDPNATPESESSRRAVTTGIAVGVVALVVLAAGGVVALGVQPPTASDATANATATPTPTPTATPTPTPTASPTPATGDGGTTDASHDTHAASDAHADGGSGTATPTPKPERPFSLAIRNVETCGKTCRDVTVSLTNNADHPRRDVAVTTKMYAGKTAGENRVWTGEKSVGRLGAGASTTRTQRVKVGFLGGAKIKRHGGTVTVVTVVRWDGGSVRFTERKRVA
ncbi:MAG: hypothetical protein ABEJ81_01035 [Haloferacaceae archaeon]